MLACFLDLANGSAAANVSLAVLTVKGWLFLH
jgi:hypothetical protein